MNRKFAPAVASALFAFILIFWQSHSIASGWQFLNGPTGYFSPQSVVYHQGGWYVSSNINGSSGTGIWKSTSNGLSWTNVSAGLPKPYARDIISFNNNLYITCDTAVYVSSNGGNTWTIADQGLPNNTGPYELEIHNNSVYTFVSFANGDVGIFYLPNGTGSWVSAGHIFSLFSTPTEMYSSGTTLWAATQGGVFKSTDHGATFNYSGNNIPFSSSITSIIAKGDTAYCGTNNGSYYTTDGGQLWMPIVVPSLGSPLYTYCWKIVGSTLFAGFTNHGIYATPVGQTSFTALGTGYITSNVAWQMASDGNYLFAATSEGIFSCLVSGGTWQNQNSNITRARTRIAFAGNGVMLAGVGAYSGLQKTNNGGSTWTNAGLQSQFRLFNKGLMQNNRILLPSNNSLHYSDDNGLTFTQVLTPPIPFKEVRKYGNNLIACGNNQILQSTDNGTTWNSLGTGLPAQATINCINTNGSKIYAGTNNGIYQYDPISDSWSNFSQGLSPTLSIQEIEVVGLTLIINTFQSIYKRSILDTLWRPGAGNNFFSDLLSFRGFLFGAGYNGISYSDDAGKTFRPFNDSLPVYAGEAENLFGAGNDLICGMREYSAWRRTIQPSLTIYGGLPPQVCAGDSFTVNVINTDPVTAGNKYILQLSDPAGDFYTLAAMDSIVSTATTFSLTARIPLNAISSDYYRLRVVSTSPYRLSDQYENPLSVKELPVIQWQPASQSICEGQNTGFFAQASTDECSYQWQVDVNGSGTFANISNGTLYQGTDTNILIIQGAPISMNGYRYRCLISHPCTTLITSSSTLTINTLTPILTQPVNDTICLGGGSSFTVTTQTPGNLYQWQSSTGGIFSNLTSSGGQFTGINTPTLTIAFTQSTDVNRRFRCLINGCTYSDTVSIVLNAIPLPATLPALMPYCDGAFQSLNVQYAGGGLTYQWERDMGTGFSALVNDAFHQSVNTSTLLFTGIPASFNNYLYRCKVNGLCVPDSSYSTIAQLQLNPQPAINQPPSSISICESDSATFTISANGTSISYQWEMNDGSGWQPVPTLANISGINSSTLTIADTPLQFDGFQFRCRLSSCVTTQAATLDVKATPPVVAPPIFWCHLFINIPLSDATPPGGTYFGNYIENNFFVYDWGTGYIQSVYDYIYTAPNGCTGMASNVIFVGNCASIAETEGSTQRFRIYPNPASGQVFIRNLNSSKDYEDVSIALFDLNGRLLKENTGIRLTQEFPMNIEELPEGMYLVRLTTEGQIFTEKLLIMR